METNVGRITLAEFRARHGLIRYAATLDEFRQLAAVAAAQDLAVVNGGYTYDTELIERLPAVDRQILVERLEPSDLTTRFDAVDPATELALRPFVAAAQRALDRLGCEVVLRAFDPVSLPALYLVEPVGARSTTSSQPARERADELWAGVLDALAASGAAGPAAAGAQPPQPAGPPGHRARATRSWSARRRGAVRPGAAARLPPDPAGRRRAAQQLFPRPARPGRTRIRSDAVTATDDLPAHAARGANDAVRRRPDRRCSSSCIRRADAAGRRRAARSPPGCSATTGVRLRRRAGEVVRHLLLVPGRLRPQPAAVPRAPRAHAALALQVHGQRAAELPRGAAGPHVRGARRHGAPLPRRRAQPAGGVQACGTGWPGTSATTTRPRTWYELWSTTPRDDLSDCAGCDPSAQAGYLADAGRDEEAIALAEPVLAGRLTCVEQPQAMLTALLLPYLRTGRRRRGPRRAPAGVPAGPGATWPTWATSASTSSSAPGPATRPAAWRSSSGTWTGWTGRRRRPRRCSSPKRRRCCCGG